MYPCMSEMQDNLSIWKEQRCKYQQMGEIQLLVRDRELDIEGSNLKTSEHICCKMNFLAMLQDEETFCAG
jgi:hypothetical protein